MGLFDHFKSKDIESMDELKQMDLKPKRNDKVLTADEAFKKSIQAQDTHNKEVLSSVFERINHAVDTGIRSITLSDDWGSGFTLSDFRSLEKLLPKYGFKVRVEKEDSTFDAFLTISWDKENYKKDKSNGPKIDPDKKYILPMEGTDWIDKGVRHYATIHENYWEPLKWTGGFLPPYGLLYEVQGRDILDGPDWVKAIKPIEVKE
ncbi:hypothetical protein DKZ26_10600 [Limosilactobacillus reuteri]|nr:hypothetical protein [Limosilactobacillus reuteri]PWT34142.1 hypothetical protein DKZ21_00695 [Limosilactobacillus reuteri]PWT45574.1 hypothetical protein DKZ25_00695 [Limosilactobacillus reuteri]PWT68188.1 hypothetical protein DKZ26_10600 [Limosilactobacillus reuteri]